MGLVDWIKNYFKSDRMTTPTYYRDGQLFFKELKKENSILGDRLVINPNKLKNIASFIQKNEIKSITINPSYFKVDNLDFLKDIPFIEGLYILQSNLDLSPLSYLTNLRVFTIDRLEKPLDFTKYQNLEVLGITYSKNTINIGSCENLFWLWIDNYSKHDLQELQGLRNLKYLSLYKTAIKNLTGFESLVNIHELHIDSASKLESLSGISENNKQLELVDIYGAKNLTDYSAIIKGESIKRLRFGRTGNISSISFLKVLPKLENAVIGMKVEDGDMSFLKDLPEAGFVDYPHYNLKMKDIKKTKINAT